MSNNLQSILAGAFFDQLCEGPGSGKRIADIEPERLQGSLYNPLQTMRLMTLDVIKGEDFGAEALAGATGVPANWFKDKYLDAPAEEVVITLGKMALIYLSSLRNWALLEEFKTEAKEDCLRAEATFSEVLAMNKKLKGLRDVPAAT